MEDAEDGRELKGVGRDLRGAREAAGKQLKEVTKALHINALFLEAIEAGRYTDLPETVYVYGFVRTYADYLQLDADEMVRRVRLELTPEIIPDELHFPAAPQDAPRPSRNLLLLAMLLGAVVIGFWYLNLGFETAPAPDVASPPSELQANQPAPAPGSGSESGAVEAPPPGIPPAATPPQAADIAPEPELASESPLIPPVEELVSRNSPAATTQTETNTNAIPDQAVLNGNDAILAEEILTPEITTSLSVPPVTLTDMSEGIIVLGPSPPLQAEPAPRSASESAAPVQPEQLANGPVVFRASADTWMQVSYANGAVMKSWVMRSGEQFVPPADQPGLKVMIGNAGALNVYVDGAILPPLGAKGVVIRDVPLDAAGLKARFGG